MTVLNDVRPDGRHPAHVEMARGLVGLLVVHITPVVAPVAAILTLRAMVMTKLRKKNLRLRLRKCPWTI